MPTSTTKERLSWQNFVAIAYPYFLPRSRHGGKLTLGLILLLLMFLFGLLFLLISGAVMLGQIIAPDITTKLAGGLVTIVNNTFASKQIIVPALTLLIPLSTFLLLRKRLKGHGKGWVLLGIVLLLSLSVTGINVAFSYIGNFFTNALVAKNEEMSYFYVITYFCGFLIGIPVVAFYGYVRDYLGLHWRD